jgi:cytochrome c oxidase subunit I+III
MSATRPTIDASVLPAEALGSRTPAWYGNVLFMAIETTTVLLLLASYFYLWRNFPQEQWPPPRADKMPAIERPVPDLLYGTLNILLLVATVPLAVVIDRACRRQFEELERLNVSKPEEAPEDVRPAARPLAVIGGLALLILLGLVSCLLRVKEFPALLFDWNDNAYASLVWTALGLHLVYVVIEVVEFLILAAWTAIYGLGENQAGDVILSAEYWYWTVAIGALIYGVVYWFPRVV